jgi:succinyl-CoA synthetase beta subunit
MEYEKAHSMLKRYGIKSIESKYVNSADEAVRFAKKKPIVLKAISNRALHKTKSGLIKLDLETEHEIRAAYMNLEKKAARFKPYKILAQHMVKNGLEIIVGGKVDPQFGKLVLIGLGGIYVETFKDFALRVCPIKKYDAIEMLNQLKSKKVIAPNEKSERMIEELLLKVSKMLEHNNISELDLNPLILHDGTYDAVDLRILE